MDSNQEEILSSMLKELDIAKKSTEAYNKAIRSLQQVARAYSSEEKLLSSPLEFTSKTQNEPLMPINGIKQKKVVNEETYRIKKVKAEVKEFQELENVPKNENFLEDTPGCWTYEPKLRESRDLKHLKAPSLNSDFKTGVEYSGNRKEPISEEPYSLWSCPPPIDIPSISAPISQVSQGNKIIIPQNPYRIPSTTKTSLNSSSVPFVPQSCIPSSNIPLPQEPVPLPLRSSNLFTTKVKPVNQPSIPCSQESIETASIETIDKQILPLIGLLITSPAAPTPAWCDSLKISMKLIGSPPKQINFYKLLWSPSEFVAMQKAETIFNCRVSLIYDHDATQFIALTFLNS